MTSHSEHGRRLDYGRAHRRLIDELDRAIEEEAAEAAARQAEAADPLPPALVYDCGRGTTAADRRAVQAYDDWISRLDKEGR